VLAVRLYEVVVGVYMLTAETVMSELHEVHGTSLCQCSDSKCVPAAVAVVNKLKYIKYFSFFPYVCLVEFSTNMNLSVFDLSHLLVSVYLPSAALSALGLFANRIDCGMSHLAADRQSTFCIDLTTHERALL